MESETTGVQCSGESDSRGLQTQEVEMRSNRSSASFLITSRPNSLEIALWEAFKNTNCESDLSGKFLGEIEKYGDYLVIEETCEHSELHEDSLPP